MVTFKYQENMSHEELMGIAQARIQKGYNAVIANRGEESGPHGEQVAHLVVQGHDPQKMTGKKNIAVKLADFLETI